MCAFHAELNRAPASGASRASRRYAPSGSVHSCALRSTCNRRAQARSSASAPARTCRHRSRSPFTLVSSRRLRAARPRRADPHLPRPRSPPPALPTTAGPERGVGLRQLLERPRRLQSAARGADRLAGRFRHPVRRAAMPALAPHLRLLDPARQARLDRRAQPLARAASSNSCRCTSAHRACDGISSREICSSSPSTCANTPPPRDWTPTGEAGTSYEHMFDLSSPALEPLDDACPTLAVALVRRRRS